MSSFLWNLCFPIAVLFLTLLMHIACLTFYLTVSSVLILFSLCATETPLQRPFCIPHTFYHTRGCKMMSDHISCLLHSHLFLFFRSFFCAIDPHHHPHLNSILNCMINLVSLQSSAVFYCICDTPLSLFLNTRCRQWQSLRSGITMIQGFEPR